MDSEILHLRELLDEKLNQIKTINELQSMDLSDLKSALKEQVGTCGDTHRLLNGRVEDHEARISQIESEKRLIKWIIMALGTFLGGVGAMWSQGFLGGK